MHNPFAHCNCPIEDVTGDDVVRTLKPEGVELRNRCLRAAALGVHAVRQGQDQEAIARFSEALIYDEEKIIDGGGGRPFTGGFVWGIDGVGSGEMPKVTVGGAVFLRDGRKQVLINRGIAYLRLGQWQSALNDGEEAVECRSCTDRGRYLMTWAEQHVIPPEDKGDAELRIMSTSVLAYKIRPKECAQCGQQRDPSAACQGCGLGYCSLACARLHASTVHQQTCTHALDTGQTAASASVSHLPTSSNGSRGGSGSGAGGSASATTSTQQPKRPKQKQKRLPRRCTWCDATHAAEGAKLKLCGGCHTVYYCSVACQRAHWPDHKPICKSVHKPKKSLLPAQELTKEEVSPRTDCEPTPSQPQPPPTQQPVPPFQQPVRHPPSSEPKSTPLPASPGGFAAPAPAPAPAATGAASPVADAPAQPSASAEQMARAQQNAARILDPARSNKVTEATKAFILRCFLGQLPRQNPSGKPIQIILHEEEKYEEHLDQYYTEFTIFEIDAESGRWRKLKKKRRKPRPM